MRGKRQPFISCIVPVHNEAELIKEFLISLADQLTKLSARYEILVVDDGSNDNTVEQILSLTNKQKLPVKLLVLSRNFGKEQALTAGLDHCQGDLAILIDADFQHPLTLLTDFMEKWREGYQMVYGVRNDRASESWLKRYPAQLFYYLINKTSRLTIPANAGDFRLLDRQVIDAIKALPERRRLMKGLYAWVGFKSIAVPFDVANRSAGQSSWKVSKLTNLALTGLTSFTEFPLRLMATSGLLIAFCSFIYALWIIAETLIWGNTVPGWATVVVAIIFFGGVQLLAIGVLGEYIAGIFNEVKQRPLYIVQQRYGFTAKTRVRSTQVKPASKDTNQPTKQGASRKPASVSDQKKANP
jgi:glycosyltransferase involved in cell wall biosynthesis